MSETKRLGLDQPSRSFRKAEEAFLNRIKPGRRQAQKIINAIVTRRSTPDFFNDIIDDEMEKLLWQAFILGIRPVMGPDGRPMSVDGVVQMEPWKPEVIQWQAFQKAVAYKRGQPPASVKLEDPAGAVKHLEIITIGSQPDEFRDAAIKRGLLKGA